MIIPPEAPIEGINAKESKRGGQIVLRTLALKSSILDSCKHMIEQPEELIALDNARSFLGEFKPRTFQHSTFQLCKRDIKRAKIKGELRKRARPD